MATTVTTNDAAGGAGSLLRSVLDVAVNGVSRAIDGELSRRYPVTSFNENATYDAYGNLQPRSAPSSGGSGFESIRGALSNPLVIAVGSAVGITLLLLAAFALARK